MNTHRQALPEGHMLQEYQVGRVLGAGGFGLTYLGWDTALDKAVAIKEYLPNELAVREADYSIAPKSADDEKDFSWGLERFMEEARTLAKFEHPGIVAVHRFFKAHNTAYIVMEYAEGETLGALLRREKTINEARLLAILKPLLAGLQEVHRAGFLHRDIKPGNVIIRTDGGPVLVDFGSARQAVGARSRSITSVVTPGYAPIEQYSSRGNQGPWTDIYALGALCYRALSGVLPPDATERTRKDPMQPVAQVLKMEQGKHSAAVLHAIDWALQVDEERRPQHVAAWRAALAGEVLGDGDEELARHRSQVRTKSTPTEATVAPGQSASPSWQPAHNPPATDASQPKTAAFLKPVLWATGAVALVAMIFTIASTDLITLLESPTATCARHYENRDYAKALVACTEAAAQESAAAQFNLGRMHDDGQGVAEDDAAAARWYAQAAALGHEEAAAALARLDELATALARAQAAEQQAAAAQETQAAQQADSSFRPYQPDQDAGRTVAISAAAQQSPVAACTSLFALSAFAEAKQPCTTAAEAGDITAQNNVAWMYHYGIGVVVNDAVADKWFGEAAKQDDAWGTERGIKATHVRLVLRKRAQGGSTRAQFTLGMMYHLGIKASKDLSKAVRWYSEAATRGVPGAQFMLASFYEKGRGVPQNKAEAIRWYTQAANQGNRYARKRLEMLGR